MRACHLFWTTLKEDYGDSLTSWILSLYEFSVKERARLKARLHILGDFNTVWKTETQKLDERIKRGNPLLLAMSIGPLFYALVYALYAWYALYENQLVAYIINHGIAILLALPWLIHQSLSIQRHYERALYESIKPTEELSNPIHAKGNDPSVPSSERGGV